MEELLQDEPQQLNHFNVKTLMPATALAAILQLSVNDIQTQLTLCVLVEIIIFFL